MQGEGKRKEGRQIWPCAPSRRYCPRPTPVSLVCFPSSGQGLFCLCTWRETFVSWPESTARLCVKPTFSGFAHLWSGNGKFQACETDSCSDQIPMWLRRALAADPLSPCSPAIGARPGEGDKEPSPRPAWRRASRASPVPPTY